MKIDQQEQRYRKLETVDGQQKRRQKHWYQTNKLI